MQIHLYKPFNKMSAKDKQVAVYSQYLLYRHNFICDKQRALPLVKRFYDMGFNVEATKGTAKFLKDNGIRTRERRKISEGSEEIFDSLRQGHVSYVINTIDINKNMTTEDGFQIRRCAVENNVAMFTSLETVKVLLDVLEEITLGVSTIDKME